MAPDVHPDDAAVVVAALEVLVFPAAVFELPAQTMAPLMHLVPEETAPILMKAPLTQTDQLRLSDEH
jgi:hypothetical protein